MERILRFWWGNSVKSMSKNRFNCYRSIIRNSKVKVEMITPENYKEYEVVDHPIHEGFQYLSEVHKSDYLRAYVGYHYGGGWTDVKYCDTNWNQYFELLDQNPDKIGIGCRELIIANGEYKYHPDDYVHAFCVSMAHYIFRPHSRVFKKYINAIDTHLDTILDELKMYPGTVHPMVCLDNHLHYTKFPEELRNYKYPLNWMGISEHFFSAQLEDLNNIMHGMPLPHNFMTGHNHR